MAFDSLLRLGQRDSGDDFIDSRAMHIGQPLSAELLASGRSRIGNLQRSRRL